MGLLARSSCRAGAARALQGAGAMTHRDDERPPPDSLRGKLDDLFDEDDETSSDEAADLDAAAEDPLPKRPTDPPF
jgi:hypothetical protein